MGFKWRGKQQGRVEGDVGKEALHMPNGQKNSQGRRIETRTELELGKIQTQSLQKPRMMNRARPQAKQWDYSIKKNGNRTVSYRPKARD